MIVEDLLGHVDVHAVEREAGQHKMEDEQRHVANTAPDALILCSRGTFRASAYQHQQSLRRAKNGRRRT